MERRVRGNSHARCGVGENPEIASKDYLSLFPGAFSSGAPKGEDFRIVLEEILHIHHCGEELPCSFPYAWTDVGELKLEGFFSMAWRCLDAQYWGVAQRRKRIFLAVDFAGYSAPRFMFDDLEEH